MKSRTTLFTQGVYLLFAFMTLSLFSLDELSAKVSIRKASNSTTSLSFEQHSLFGQKGTTPYYLFCDGNFTLITEDAAGKTHVYIKEGGTDYPSAIAANEVSIDDLPVDWSEFIIVGGSDGAGISTTSNRTHIKMTGGNVGSIILSGVGGKSGSLNQSVGYAYLDITGGAVGLIEVENSAYDLVSYYVYMYLNNLHYLGSSKIQFGTKKAKTRLFINTNCNFYNTTSHLGIKDIATYNNSTKQYNSNFYGVLVPDSANWGQVYAYGEVSTSGAYGDYTLTCESVEANLTSIANGSKINILRCNGWTSLQDISKYSSTVTMAAHKHIQYITKAATCTDSAKFVSYCLDCNKQLTPTIDVAPLGHLVVGTQSVAATCYHEGSRNGRHCQRCGVITKAPTVDEKTDHTYLATTYSYTYNSQTLTYKKCSICSYMKIQPTTTSTGKIVYPLPNHTCVASSSSRKVIKVPACNQYGVITNPCTLCKKPVQTILLPTHPTANVSKYADAVEPTCTTGGHPVINYCSYCRHYYKKGTGTFQLKDRVLPDEIDQIIPANGHVLDSDINFKITKNIASAATCEGKALYHGFCKTCGSVMQNTFFYGEDAKGHHYHISRMYNSPKVVTQGNVLLACDDCGKELSSLPFDICSEVGQELYDGYWSGYWENVKLKQATVFPTCIPGEGIYELTLYYQGDIMRQRFTGSIPALTGLHNYDSDGICKHDDQTYTTKGYLLFPSEKPVYRTRTFYYVDKETSKPLLSLGFDLQQFDDVSALRAQIDKQLFPFYASTYFDMTLPTDAPFFNAPNMIDLNLNGHTVNASTFADKSVYTNLVDISPVNLTYTRTFSTNSWQPLYVPFALSVADLEAKGLKVARLLDVQMESDDDYKSIASVNLEFLYMNSGSTVPNRPYLIKCTGTTGSKSISLSNVTLSKAAENSIECNTFDQVVSVTGTYSGLAAGVMYNNDYYALTNSGTLSRAASTAATLSPQRWYLKFTNKDGSPVSSDDLYAAEMRITIFGDDDPEVTGITDVKEGLSAPSIYTLDGRMVDENAELAPGIYVVNGKKMIIK